LLNAGRLREGTDLRLYQEPQVSGPSASRDVFSLCGAKAALRRLSFNFWIMNRFPWQNHREKGCDAGCGGQSEDREGERVDEDSHEEETTSLLFGEFTSHGCFQPAMDQSIARRTLQDLIKQGNKSCVDCGNPNPQWASLRCPQFFPSTRHFPKSVFSASPYSSACNAPEFTEASACTSGELIYVTVSRFLNDHVPYVVLSAPYRWTLGKRIKFGE
jgi:hypothetical protein